MEAAASQALLLLPPKNQNSEETNGYSRVMANLIDALFEEVAAKYSRQNNASLPITADQLKSRIQYHVQENFPSLHTPTHPTYAMMIQSAIKELGENKGSSEEAISDFIKREYQDLPLAHSMFLQRHLGNLCESGELVNSNGRFMISVGVESVSKRETKRGRGRRRLKPRRDTVKDKGGDFGREKQSLGDERPEIEPCNVRDGETEEGHS